MTSLHILTARVLALMPKPEVSPCSLPELPPSPWAAGEVDHLVKDVADPALDSNLVRAISTHVRGAARM